MRGGLLNQDSSLCRSAIKRTYKPRCHLHTLVGRDLLPLDMEASYTMQSYTGLHSSKETGNLEIRNPIEPHLLLDIINVLKPNKLFLKFGSDLQFCDGDVYFGALIPRFIVFLSTRRSSNGRK